MVGRAVLCAIAVLLAHSPARQDGPTAVPGSAGPIPPQYWGLHIHRAGSLMTWPAGFGSWRLWDARVAWSDLEPRPGQWQFQALDAYVELAHERGIEVLLPLGMSRSEERRVGKECRSHCQRREREDYGERRRHRR